MIKNDVYPRLKECKVDDKIKNKYRIVNSDKTLNDLNEMDDMKYKNIYLINPKTVLINLGWDNIATESADFDSSCFLDPATISIINSFTTGMEIESKPIRMNENATLDVYKYTNKEAFKTIDIYLLQPVYSKELVDPNINKIFVLPLNPSNMYGIIVAIHTVEGNLRMTQYDRVYNVHDYYDNFITNEFDDNVYKGLLSQDDKKPAVTIHIYAK